ncbi:hypothetical protein Fmac_025371 [Flemingia macrophylla]|uniref:Uncharacterized protein n=1 Tax=Flemingia macrophylla TaxID=520843 RepID=A0ABD1LSM5_9FABA
MQLRRPLWCCNGEVEYLRTSLCGVVTVQRTSLYGVVMVWPLEVVTRGIDEVRPLCGVPIQGSLGMMHCIAWCEHGYESWFDRALELVRQFGNSGLVLLDNAYGALEFFTRKKHSEGYFPAITMLCRESKIDEMKELMYIVVGRNFVPHASMYDKFIMSLHREMQSNFVSPPPRFPSFFPCSSPRFPSFCFFFPFSSFVFALNVFPSSSLNHLVLLVIEPPRPPPSPRHCEDNHYCR